MVLGVLLIEPFYDLWSWGTAHECLAHGYCKQLDSEFLGVCALIIDLGDMAIHIAPGLPCTSEFQTIKVDDIPVQSHSNGPAVMAHACTVCVPM